MPSLRRRLLIGTGIGSGVILLAAGVALYLMMRSSLVGEFENGLRDKVVTLADMVEQEHGRTEVEFAEADMAAFSRDRRPEYYEVWSADGRVVSRAPSLGTADLATGPLPEADAVVVRRCILPDGRPGRVAVTRFTPRMEGLAPATVEALTLALARDTLDLDSALAGLRVALMVVGVVAILATAALLSVLIKLGLAPVGRLTQQISAVDAQRLSSRIDPGATPQELSPIVGRLNDLLERLELAFQREKSLTAHVAHELRTPLAGLRSTIEVARSRERQPQEYRETLDACLNICTQTQTLIENLLTLSRLDAGIETGRPQATDLRRLLHDAWQPFDESARQRLLQVDWKLANEMTAQTDPDHLRLVLSNVFSNAVSYADPGGRVVISGRTPNGQAHIRITNSGSKVSADDMARVFDRFWRGDPARQQTPPHCGLGLALCKIIIEQAGGSIAADVPQPGHFAVDIALPAA